MHYISGYHQDHFLNDSREKLYTEINQNVTEVQGRRAAPLDSASARGRIASSGQGGNAAERAKGKDWNSTTACIRDIFSHGMTVPIRGFQNRSAIEIHPHFIKYKRNILHQAGPGAKRGKITNFSKKSRQRLLQTFGRIVDYPSVWQDFTFPDDVMENKSITERAKFSTKAETEFRRRVERKYPDLWGIIRREWETRKSGRIIGEECPHLHVLWEKGDIAENNFRRICMELAQIWIDVIKTEEREKALTVALHPKSYRWIINRRMAQGYVSKYIAKIEVHKGGPSRGRYWMTIGDVPLEEPIEIPISDKECDLLRRLFRKKIGDKKKYLYRILRSRYFATWFFIEAVTVKLMLEHVRERLADDLEHYAPF